MIAGRDEVRENLTGLRWVHILLLKSLGGFLLWTAILAAFKAVWVALG